MAFKMEIKGGDALRKNLRKLSLNFADRVSKAAARAGGAVFLKEARKTVPRRSGVLRKSLTQKIVVNQKNTGHASIVGAKKPGSRYLHLALRPVKAHVIPEGNVKGIGWRESIRHPGSKGSKTFERVLKSKSKAATAAYAKKFAEATRRLT